jgi:hypothetical protein
VSDPLGLAAFVLRLGGIMWSREQVRWIIEKGRRTIIWLPETVPVHIIYQTSWIDKNDITYFNNDIYGRDERLLKTLFKESIMAAIQRWPAAHHRWPGKVSGPGGETGRIRLFLLKPLHQRKYYP